MSILINLAIALFFSVVASFFAERPEGPQPQGFDDNSVRKKEGADIPYLVGTNWHSVQPHWDGDPGRSEIKSKSGKK